MNIKSSQIREFINLVGESGIVQQEGFAQLKNIFADAYNWQSIATDKENFKMGFNRRIWSKLHADHYQIADRTGNIN